MQLYIVGCGSVEVQLKRNPANPPTHVLPVSELKVYVYL